MHGIFYDEIHDEIVVPVALGGAVLTLPGDAAGDAPPKRVLQGPKTGIVQPDTNVFWDLLPHDLSIFDSVFPGGFRPKAVSAVGVDPIGAGHACVGYVTMVMPDDAIVHVHVSWLSPVKMRTVVIGGSRRHIVWDDTDPTQRISVYERGIDIALQTMKICRLQINAKPRRSGAQLILEYSANSSGGSPPCGSAKSSATCARASTRRCLRKACRTRNSCRARRHRASNSSKR